MRLQFIIITLHLNALKLSPSSRVEIRYLMKLKNKQKSEENEHIAAVVAIHPNYIIFKRKKMTAEIDRWGETCFGEVAYLQSVLQILNFISFINQLFHKNI